MAVITFPFRNKLAYPAGRLSGFDPSHVAAANCPFSGVATYGGNFGHVLSRVKGTKNGSPKTTSILGSLGPATNYINSSDNSIFPFVSAASAPVTLAAILSITSALPTSGYILNTAAAGACAIGDGENNGTFNGYANNASTGKFLTGVSYLFGVPYFLAASFSVTTINWVLVRMDTGQTWSASVANAASAVDAGDGTITVGSRSGASRQIKGGIAAAMASNAFMSQQATAAMGQRPPGHSGIRRKLCR